ncbi:ECM29 [Mytilus edulis]|uniref:ECM29 n=1 Tax=Mytilus edulis TaxID=6550 RepID=A0A8S3T961_MYTED|nr:ECM29 [Mytilus edulis]
MGEEKRQSHIRDFIKIYTEKSSIIETRIKEKELKEAKILAEKENNILDINNLGGKWTTLDQIYSFISTCKTKKLKLNAIKSQITYRKEIQMQKVDSNSKHLFKKSLDLPELTENLKKLIQLEQTYLENRDELIEDMETDALTIAADNHTNYIAPYIESDHNNNVPCIMDTSILDHEVQHDVNEPTNYVGKHIIHIWDEGSNNLTEYDGKLLDYNSATMTFRVAYWNSKKGHKFHKRLRKYELSLQEFKDDMKSGDLKIM